MTLADREKLHGAIDRAISRLRKSQRVGEKTYDLLYRMALVGAMAASAPKAQQELAVYVLSGKRLAERTWQEILGE